MNELAAANSGAVSTRLPNSEIIMLERICKKQNTTKGEYLRDVLIKAIARDSKK